jgi:hypothetical protein
MTGADPPLSPFELVATELRALGIALARLPGEYRVNFRNGSDAIARMAETLGEALELGRSMAADAPAGPAHGKRRRRPRRMTPKAYNRRLRMAHLRRMRARAIGEQREGGKQLSKREIPPRVKSSAVNFISHAPPADTKMKLP